MRWLATILILSLGGCAAEDPVGVSSAALGEPTDGFPSWGERVVHVWTNRARQDPAADLASCSVCAEKACYSPRPPLVWSHAHARAARFHSDNLARAGCSLQHDSPCTVVSDIDSRYTPGSCNGAPSCACAGGTASCGSSGTGFGARIGLFGGSARAENIATGSDPVTTFYRWLHEPDSSSACGWRIANGHRANILGDARQIGVGKTTAGGIWTQDFGPSGSPDGIVGGVHYPATGASIEFRASWYRAAAPTAAVVNVGGTCHPMTLERGSGANGTYLATVTGLSGCVRYVFQLTDGGGDVFYPSTGSFGIGCADDWSSTRPPTCGCAPDCAGRSCGDDGCGGSCGSCASGRTCDAAGACVCASGTTDCGGSCVDTASDASHCGGCGNACGGGESCTAGACVSTCTRDCSGRSCGDDGCGGTCGSCSGGRVCDAAGACACAAARTDCGGSCVDTATDPSHCGACGAACASGESCAGGACLCAPDCAGRSCGGDGCGGSCGTCGADRLCADGRCACLGAFTDCGGACVDVRIDELHCGACGAACASTETCVAGACEVAGPDAGCAPACDGRGCGDDTCGGLCGDCAGARVCGGGVCLCPDSTAECDGACVDLRADDAHCGACGTACASDQRCVASECVGGAPPIDGGSGVDGGSGRDAGLGAVDAGTDRVLRGACGCRVGTSAPSGGWLAAALLALFVRRHRRRASNHRSR